LFVFIYFLIFGREWEKNKNDKNKQICGDGYGVFNLFCFATGNRLGLFFTHRSAENNRQNRRGKQISEKS
jgi:hypothetical protein